MSLSTAAVRATIAVADLGRATAFYEGVLGLEAEPGGPDGVRTYPCGAGTVLQVHASAEARPAGGTAASFTAEDHDAVVDALLAAGATFETYDGLDADDRGVHRFGDHAVVWLQDPDGNVLAVDNGRTPA